MRYLLTISSLFSFSICFSQNELPFREIPSYPDSYTAATVAARMVDGLGFRYYWGTEGLREDDLAYKISESSRTAEETLYHIYGLAEVVYSSVKQQPSVRPLPEFTMTFEEMRSETLSMLKESSDILRTMSNEDMEGLTITFQRGDKKSSFPFWHQLNGPLADAIWHVGQVVASRRASGNPIDNRVSVFMGKRRND